MTALCQRTGQVGPSDSLNGSAAEVVPHHGVGFIETPPENRLNVVIKTSPSTLNEALARVASAGMLHADFETVRHVALGVWYGEESPAWGDLKGNHFTEAVLLVERLSYYNVVPQSRKKTLLASCHLVLGALSPVMVEDFERAYKKLLPLLQPFQTRHYAGTLLQMNTPGPAKKYTGG